MQGQKWMQKLLDEMDLADETLPGVPVVEISGENRVLIERHNGVSEYSRDRISVKVKFGLVCVCGSELCLAKMTQEKLIISGEIHCVQFQRRLR